MRTFPPTHLPAWKVPRHTRNIEGRCLAVAPPPKRVKSTDHHIYLIRFINVFNCHLVPPTSYFLGGKNTSHYVCIRPTYLLLVYVPFRGGRFTPQPTWYGGQHQVLVHVHTHFLCSCILQAEKWAGPLPAPDTCKLE